MKIGGTRPEEARVFDSHGGYHEFHAEETQEPYGSFEVFWQKAEPGVGIYHDASADDEHPSPRPAGWYWHACFPGCIPDGEPSGPFATSRDARKDADEWAPEFDRNFQEGSAEGR